MSIGNLVQSTLTTAISATDTVITLDAAVAPFSLPPTDGGTLILADSLNRPTRFEIIKYSARSGQNLTGVTRAREGTTAQSWSVGGLIYQSLTSNMFRPVLSTQNRTTTTLELAVNFGGDVGISHFATLPAVTTSLSGLMGSVDKAKLDGIASGAEVNVPTNLSITYAAAKATLASSTGTSVDINAATASNAGLMTAADKTKIDTLEPFNPMDNLALIYAIALAS